MSILAIARARFFAKGHGRFHSNINSPVRAAATAVILAICLVFGACSERMNRDDFVTLLKGKTEQEVLKVAGKPTKVANATSGPTPPGLST